MVSLGLSVESWHQSSSLWLVLLIPVCLLVLYVVKQRYFHPLARYPGPFLASLTDLWSAWLAYKGNWQTVLDDLHGRHGQIIRIAPNEVSISDPASMKTIYAITGGFSKSGFYDPFRIPTDPPSIFTEKSEARHTERRRLVGSAFSMKNLLLLEPHVQTVIARFVKQLDENFATTEQVADMSTWFYRMAYDVSGQLSVGRSFDAIESGDKFGFMSLFADRNAEGGVLGRAPEWARPIMRRFSKTTSLQVYTDITEYMDSALHSHLTDPINHSDMMSFLLALGDTKSGRPVPPDNVKRDVKSVIAAGSDTTASSITALFHYVCRDRRVYAALEREVDTQALTLEAGQPFSATQTELMPYLGAVIQETLRVHSGVGFPLPRVVPDGGVVIAGDYFPAGVVVGMNAWQVHRNEEIFGSDARDFRPERWFPRDLLDATEIERVKNMERHMFAFGAGTRTCIGKHISLMEMRIAVPELLRHFEFGLEDPEKELECVNMWFVTTRNVRCYVKRRKAIIG